MDLEEDMEQPSAYGENVLCEFHTYLLSKNNEMLFFNVLGDRNKYSCAEDFLLSLFLPPLVPEILAYYEAKGPPMRIIYRKRFIDLFEKNDYEGALFCFEEAQRSGHPKARAAIAKCQNRLNRR